ncbi:quinone oxidoreductase family protein [Companilactobacillus insicii]|uniref:quinone oxidoreductase family protein n=1 Tax=Companilactobacillus insicii TaxID=1732567 RepID=UPI000F79963B|nr:zinc-binding dehydrogenase [Companilactobacillus insicii]
MKAAYIDRTGAYNEIKIGELPTPKIKDNEILVRIDYTSVNHVDTFVRAGGFETNMKFPFVIGRDAIGTVEQVGSAVNKFKIGDYIWTNSMGYDGRNGVTSELASIPESRAFKAPDVDKIKLIATLHSSATAAIVLNDIFEVKHNKNILIEGAAGHVGTKLVQLSKLSGLNVTTTSNSKDFERLKKLGSGQTIDYHTDISEVPGMFDYIIDTSGKVSLNKSLKKLNLYGQVVLITSPSDNQFKFDVKEFYTSSKSIKGFVISHAKLEQIQKASRVLNYWLDRGYLLDDDYEILPLEDASKAHMMLEKGTDGGKRLVLKVK